MDTLSRIEVLFFTTIFGLLIGGGNFGDHITGDGVFSSQVTLRINTLDSCPMVSALSVETCFEKRLLKD